MNSKKKLFLVLFLCLVLIQLYVPISMIIDYEMAHSQGQQFKFKAMPVDPYDPFRGRYVSINIQGNEIPVADGKEYKRGQKVYVSVEKDQEGFAKMSGISRTAPKDSPYFKTKVQYVRVNEGGKNVVIVQIPFNRYYMEEKLAPEAEKEYSRNAGLRESDVYVTVHLYSGMAVIEKLYIKDVPIEEYLKSKK